MKGFFELGHVAEGAEDAIFSGWMGVGGDGDAGGLGADDGSAPLGFSEEELLALLKLARKGIGELVALQKQALV